MVNSARRPDRRHWIAAARHPARRDGAVAVVLFLLPAVVALAFGVACSTNRCLRRVRTVPAALSSVQSLGRHARLPHARLAPIGGLLRSGYR